MGGTAAIGRWLVLLGSQEDGRATWGIARVSQEAGGTRRECGPRAFIVGRNEQA